MTRLNINIKINTNQFKTNILSYNNILVNRSRFNNNNWSLIKITTFIDKIININEFVRIIGNKVYYFLDNKLYFISRVKPSKGFVFNAIILDVETFDDENNNKNIYCILLYDGVKAKSFYLTDFNDVHSLINEVLKTIFTKNILVNIFIFIILLNLI